MTFFNTLCFLNDEISIFSFFRLESVSPVTYTTKNCKKFITLYKIGKEIITFRNIEAEKDKFHQ